jgi:hypothetical protein
VRAHEAIVLGLETSPLVMVPAGRYYWPSTRLHCGFSQLKSA